MVRSRGTTSWGIVPGASGVLRRGAYDDGAGSEIPAPQVLSQTEIRKAASLTAGPVSPRKNVLAAIQRRFMGLCPVPGALPRAWNKMTIKFMG